MGALDSAAGDEALKAAAESLDSELGARVGIPDEIAQVAEELSGVHRFDPPVEEQSGTAYAGSASAASDTNVGAGGVAEPTCATRGPVADGNCRSPPSHIARFAAGGESRERFAWFAGLGARVASGRSVRCCSQRFRGCCRSQLRCSGLAARGTASVGRRFLGCSGVRCDLTLSAA